MSNESQLNKRTKQRFYVTFGQKYAHEPHPMQDRLPFIFNPHGYVRIIADSFTDGRRIAFELFGTYWAFFYTEEEFKSQAQFFPLGRLFTVEDIDGVLVNPDETGLD